MGLKDTMPAGDVIESCVNIADTHCYISSEGAWGRTCDLYEPGDGSNYRKDFAMFSSVKGPLLEPDFDPVVLGLR